MKVAVVALVCVLRFAVPALAVEAARPQSPAPPPPPPPVALQPWVDPGSAQQVGKERPATNAPVPAPASAKMEAPAPRGAARPRQEEASRESPHQRQCLNAVETRQTVAAHRLAEPFRALRAGRQQGDALRAKLCKWKQDQFVYEVFVLRRDGRVVRLYMNAQNGQAVGALDDDHH